MSAVAGARGSPALAPSAGRAAAELLLRRRIRGSLAQWARYCGFDPAPHHQLIIRELEAVSRGELENLLIFMPPGSAKSTYVSVLFPSWHLANRPRDNILAATHSVEFAERWGRRVRNVQLPKSRGASAPLGSRLGKDPWRRPRRRCCDDGRPLEDVHTRASPCAA